MKDDGFVAYKRDSMTAVSFAIIKGLYVLYRKGIFVIRKLQQ